ncbi:MAG: hypothetical protein HFJ12_03630 [Bacilli bacterium]|nr:hypothetical protein [Bacilli bacterium]
MSKNSISPKVALAVSSKVAGYIKELDGYMTQLAEAVEHLNTTYWYGGENANGWYNNMAAHYINALSANQRLLDMNNKFKKQVIKYKNASDSK